MKPVLEPNVHCRSDQQTVLADAPIPSMRSLDSARESWEEFTSHKTLDELRKAVRLDGESSLATTGSRSACWKAFLLFENLDTTSWPQSLVSSRSAYNSVRTHFLRHLENPDELASTHDPLSEDADTSSPWTHMREDEELRVEIHQDVIRCMPENLYFRQPDTQRILLDILFVFCKLNPDVSYRQGMHELLAPILWVVERDAIELGQSSKILGEDATTIKVVFDADFIEHDTFALFAQVMQSAKNFYEQTTHQGKENPMVARSRRIFDVYMPLVDAELAGHLSAIDVVPQVFLMRWIRLLFGREFAFENVLSIWDVLLAEDPSLELVDHLCLTMILRMRWQLMDADLNEALGLLLRYPDGERDFVPQSLVLDALYLRAHMDRSGGSYLVHKYTGRAIPHGNRSTTPPPMQRNITTFSGSSRPNSSGFPTRAATQRQPRNIEAVLQTTAKNLYARGEKLGIGRAVRSAVDEVHKKAQEIRDAQTPSPPAGTAWGRRSGQLSGGAAALRGEVQRLEERSRQLAKLLEGAVGELWDYQRLAAEMKDGGASEAGSAAAVEGLGVAIAKVQFVQVYLGDPSLPLAEASAEPQAESGALVVDEKSGSTANAGAEREDSELTLGHDDAAGVGRVPVIVEKPPTPPARSHQMDGMDQSEQTTTAQPAESLDKPSDLEESSRDSPEKEKAASEPQKPEVTPDSNLQRTKSPTAPEAETAPEQKPPTPTPKKESPRPKPRLEESAYSWMLGQEEPAKPTTTTVKAVSSKSRPPRRVLFGDQGDGSQNADQRRKGSRAGAGKPSEEEEEFDISSLRHGKVR